MGCLMKYPCNISGKKNRIDAAKQASVRALDWLGVREGPCNARGRDVRARGSASELSGDPSCQLRDFGSSRSLNRN